MLERNYVASIKSNSRFQMAEGELRSSTVAERGILLPYGNSCKR